MSFPCYFHLFGFRIHPHPAMEAIAYLVGFQTYLLLRRRERQSIVGVEGGLWILVGAIFGALLGSKLLAWMESPQEFWAARHDWPAMLTGKTIVGGLLGGWLGVEVAKRILKIRIRTGDACVLPLALGIAIGRVGCFLTGLEDHTYGIASSLPWAVNFGDGITRHPTQLYESVFVLLVTGVIAMLKSLPKGSRFRVFMLGYLLFRVEVEFIKPTYRAYLGLSAIQLACLAGAFVAAWQLVDARGGKELLQSPRKEGMPA